MKFTKAAKSNIRLKKPLIKNKNFIINNVSKMSKNQNMNLNKLTTKTISHKIGHYCPTKIKTNI